MPLILTVKQVASIPLEVDDVRLEKVRELSPDAVKRIEIQQGNRRVPLGEFFDVSGSAEDNEMVWEGDCSRVKLIGSGLAAGRLRVEGSAGMHLGAEMTGGEIVVTGDAADWVGAEMHGGRIHVRGDAGHMVGGVYRGGRRGMTGGTILIDGSAGNEVGHTMRRGVIAVGGRVGDAPGFGMIAGSLLVFGQSGIRPGAGMKRGTICYAGSDEPPELLPTFRYACTYRPQFLRFFLLGLKALGCAVPDASLDADYHRYSGDFLELGKGEILVRAQ